ncbi:acetyl-CoA synthetase-like protein [Clathrospora elynae]|uniref:Acetyl-CoA synthetase-like protein n=1 Tax=Clathrospora elynae TaxID=706981 RepID=A0A6A5T2V5_9PLEO|nr:acetyl-CoA synthetase-like protein [Clathrospora elynae]
MINSPLIKRYSVAPAELEGILLFYPDISDAAVIGILMKSSEQGNEFLRAYIVIKSKSQLGQAERQAYIKARLAGYKKLIRGVRLIDTIPRNASGKTLKNVLKEMARKEISARL